MNGDGPPADALRAISREEVGDVVARAYRRAEERRERPAQPVAAWLADIVGGD